MLEPGRRRLFLDTLRPPEGYLLDRAVGTTFTLDLMTLLAVPLAFTFSDVQDQDGQIPTEPLSLLESARRYADRIVVFCHGGQTNVPRARQPALAFIEQSVVAGLPPSRGQSRGVFHPKVWVLRYAARDDTADESIRYRLVCQSRNLTFDTSWDTSLVLDGDLDQEQVRGYTVNEPLAEFIQSLPALAIEPISKQQEGILAVIVDELRRVRFSPPEQMVLNRFMSFGLGRTNAKYPDLEHRPLLIISPYLDGEFLRAVVRRRPRSVLISRREALLTAPADAISAFDEVYAFNSGLEPESEDEEESVAPLGGLHAKVYVIDDGWKARVSIGSANSTAAALGATPRNVEFIVELVGSKNKFGIEALLTLPSQGEAGTFRSLIDKFDPEEAGTVAEDKDAIRLDHLLDDASETISRADLRGTVDESDTGRYTLRLILDEPPDLPTEIGTVACWPVTLASARQQLLEDGGEFTDLSLDELSAFLAIELRATVDGRSQSRRFTRTIRLSGLPEDRLPRLIANMLRNRERFMQLLWLLLSPDQNLSFGELSELLSSEGSTSDWGVALPGLLERMLETLGSDPRKLDAVGSLLEDLRKTEEGRELIGPDFEAIWEALWTVRGRRK
ncbi:MAG: phospholipase D family protein [Chloroflexota bacterium]|nr:phospholipase D family protein [Chloroflexota bacterium]